MTAVPEPDGENTAPVTMPHGRMKRLSPEWYRGHAFVHWTYTAQDRRSGWLDAAFHARFREVQLHTLARYRLLCPIYCLMPDHLHALWAGLSPDSDQDRAASFFHKHLGRAFVDRGFALGASAIRCIASNARVRCPAFRRHSG
jgi:REP element-mobilizing transposase RayT